MKALPIALAASLLTVSAAAAAQTATDAGCILLSNAFAKNAKDANQQKLAEASFYFYLGRVGAGATAAHLEALFDQETKTLTDATAGNAMNACVKEFQGKVDLLNSLAPKPAQLPPQATPQPPKR